MGIKKAFKALGRFFKKAGLALFGQPALNKLAAAGKALLNSALGKIVWAVVAELEASTLPGADKRRAAFEKIVAQAKAAGLEVKDSFINLLIELAVQRLKGLIER